MPRNTRTSVHTNITTPLFFLLFFGLITNCVYTTQPLRPFPTPETAPIGIEVGMRCPNLVFQDEQGQRKELHDYRGKIVFINFWASWCVPCQREMPSIQKLYDNLKHDEGIVFLLLTTKRDFDASRQWARYFGYSVPQYMSTPPDDRPMITLPSIPRTLILDRNGIVIMSKIGEEYWPHWIERIRDLISSSAITARKQLSFPIEGAHAEVDIIEGKPNSTLRLSLVANNGVKLSAKRGVDLTPVGNSSIKWITPIPVTKIEDDSDYFVGPPELVLFFESSTNTATVNLKIEYGYCRSNSEECVPAKAVIEVPIHR